MTVDISPLQCRRAALVIRHSERVGGEIAAHGDPLTPRGRDMARELGSRLRGRDLDLYASPIQRCVDTAQHIAEGAGCGSQVVRSGMLGKPGPYLLDEVEVDKHLAVMGLKGFAVEWLKGRVSPKIFRPCAEGSEMLMEWICANLNSREEGIDVYVGHDLFLTPALVHYLGYDLEANGFLGFLDGFCLVQDERGTRLVYQDLSAAVDHC